MLDPVRFSRTSEMGPAMRGRIEDVVVRRLKRDINARSTTPRFCSRLPPKAIRLDTDPREARLSTAFDAFRTAIRTLVSRGPAPDAERGRSRGHVGHVIEALVFSFLIYACLAPFFGGSPVNVEVTTVEDRTTYRPTADPAFLISAMGLAILFALVVGASITHDFHMRILRWMRITYRTARDSTWIDIFIDQRRYVEVAFTDGRRLFGWPLYYSNRPEEGLLYLYDAAWIDGDGKYRCARHPPDQEG